MASVVKTDPPTDETGIVGSSRGVVAASLVMLCVIVTGSTGLCQGKSGQMLLVHDGQPRAVIVAEAQAPVEVRRGARELQDYVARITGARLEVLSPDRAKGDASRLRIHVGINPLVESQRPDLSRCEKDGAWIKTLSDRDLLIAGKTPYGTEFGVYGFLQDYCGVRWYLPGPDGTYVPKGKTLAIPRIDRLDNPFFISRQYMSATFRPNSSFPCPAAVEMDNAWYRHNRLRRHLHCDHNLGRIVVPSKHGPAHPEYFPRHAGKRYVPTTDWVVKHQPCMTNEEAVRICAYAAIRYFDEHPDELTFSLGMNDQGGYCRCSKCLGANAGPPGKNSRGLEDFARLYFGFVNRIAAMLPERHRGRYVSVLAYANARDIPPDMALHPNVAVQHVTAFTSHFNPMDRLDRARTSLVGRKCRMFGIADYWYGCGYAIPLFSVGLMEDYVDFLVSLKTRAWASETFQNWSMDGIKYYLLARKLWQPSLRVEPMLEEFCRDTFGPGAPDMLAFYNTCQDLWETQGFETSKYQIQRSVQQFVMFSEPVCERLLGQIASAKKKATNPHGRALLDLSAAAIAFTRAHARLLKHSLVVADQGCVDSDRRSGQREEDVVVGDQFSVVIRDRQQYAAEVLAALRAMEEIETRRRQMRTDAFSLPRYGGARRAVQGLFDQPETVAAPLLTAFAAAGDEAGRTAFLDRVGKDMPDFLPKIAWLAAHLGAMERQPELLPNGSFEEIDDNRYDAKGWVHGDWGSGQRYNVFVAPHGVDGGNCYYMVGVKNVFSYLPYPALKLRQEVAVEAGKWYLMRAKVRTNRRAGLLTMPAFYMSFPGARPGSLSCQITPPRYWFDAVWLFQAPARAKRAVVRFLAGAAQGQTWVDAMSMKRVPDAITPQIPEKQSLAVFPPLHMARELPGALKVDFSRKDLREQGIYVHRNVEWLKRDGETILTNSQDYIVLQIPWLFSSIHDIELRVKASGAGGPIFSVYAVDYVRTVTGQWVKKRIAPLIKTPSLGEQPQTFTAKYECPKDAQKMWFLFYRLNKKGTLNLHEVELAPVLKP